MAHPVHFLRPDGRIACNGLAVCRDPMPRENVPIRVALDECDVTCDVCRLAMARARN